MRKWSLILLTGSLLVLSACVTINVYFPAAEAEKAAREFVDKVIGPAPDGERQEPPVAEDPPPSVGLLGLIIKDAHAQGADINLKTPAILAIQQRMAQRFQSQLAAAFDAGALGFGNDGLIVLRDASKVVLRERAALNQALAEENRDRNTRYREVAIANGQPDWEAQIRQTFARQWIEGARSGWWYQNPEGGWVQR